jgi:hypothetical protein
MDSELQRYIEYLQQGLLTPGSEASHDSNTVRQLALIHRARLTDIAHRAGGGAAIVEEFDRQLAQYSPASVFDSFAARMIFQPILHAITAAAKEVDAAPQRPVVLANSTHISAGAMARPSTGEHLLFAGAGTFTFINQWAKLIGLITCKFHQRYPATSMTFDLLREFFGGADVGLGCDAVMLARHCRFTGSAVGSGDIETSSEIAPFRHQLNEAMYGFVVGHEVGHCYFQEQCEIGLGLTSVEEEAACDRYALAISRVRANHDGNWIAFTGAGAYLFLRLAAICQPLVELKRAESERTHPASVDRAEAIPAISIENTTRRQRRAVRARIAEFAAFADIIEIAVAALSEER